MLKGETITLYKKTANGLDEFNRQKWTETSISVENVLIAPMSETEIIDTLNLTGRKAIYQLAVPKGDSNEWENCRVSFWGRTFRVIGKPIEGQEHMIPLLWNKKIRVEEIDG